MIAHLPCIFGLALTPPWLGNTDFSIICNPIGLASTHNWSCLFTQINIETKAKNYRLKEWFFSSKPCVVVSTQRDATDHLTTNDVVMCTIKSTCMSQFLRPHMSPLLGSRRRGGFAIPLHLLLEGGVVKVWIEMIKVEKVVSVGPRPGSSQHCINFATSSHELSVM